MAKKNDNLSEQNSNFAGMVAGVVEFALLVLAFAKTNPRVVYESIGDLAFAFLVNGLKFRDRLRVETRKDGKFSVLSGHRRYKAIAIAIEWTKTGIPETYRPNAKEAGADSHRDFEAAQASLNELAKVKEKFKVECDIYPELSERNRLSLILDHQGYSLLKPFEKYLSAAMLLRKGLSEHAVAQALGTSRGAVQQASRVLMLPRWIQTAFENFQAEAIRLQVLKSKDKVKLTDTALLQDWWKGPSDAILAMSLSQVKELVDLAKEDPSGQKRLAALIGYSKTYENPAAPVEKRPNETQLRNVGTALPDGAIKRALEYAEKGGTYDAEEVKENFDLLRAILIEAEKVKALKALCPDRPLVSLID